MAVEDRKEIFRDGAGYVEGHTEERRTLYGEGSK